MIGYFLPTIIALGSITSYEDHKEGMIRNRYIVGAGVLGVLTYAFLALFGIASWADLGWQTVRALVALLIGFLIWQINWWSAGDAKLYAMFAFLVPAQTYTFVTTQYEPLEILINALLPVFVWLFVKLVWKTSKRQKWEAIKEVIEPKRLGLAIVAIFAITWGTQYLFQWLMIKPNIILNILLVAVGVRVMTFLFKEQTPYLMIIIAVMRIFLNTKYYTTTGFLISFLVMIVLYLLVFGFVRKLSEAYVERKNVYRLIAGDIIEEDILNSGLTSPRRRFPAERCIVRKDTPLKAKDIRKIHKMHRQGKLHFNTIQVHNTMRFAPWLFLGTMVTVVCSGNVVVFVRSAMGI